MTYDNLTPEDKAKHDELYALLGLDPMRDQEYDVLLAMARKIVTLEAS